MSEREAGNDPAPVPAATVVVIRDGEHGLETWMMHRVQAMAFAPGAAVFPGGRVDGRDADVSVPWRGTDPEAVAARLGVDVRTARELVTAALRELFEETGVLLAQPLPDVELERARAAVESRELSLAQLLARHGCSLSADALHPWGRWVTPSVERRRYDTWFFVATLPAGIDAGSVSTEADVAGWSPVAEVLRASTVGEMHVLPPTLSVLHGLVEAGSVSGVLAAAPTRSLAPVHPEVRWNDDGSIEVLAEGRVFGVRPPGAQPLPTA